MAMISKIDNDDIEDPSQWQYVKRPAYAHPLRLNAWHRTRGKRWAVRPHGVLHGGIASPNGDPDAGHHGSAHSASVVGHGACRRLLYCCRCSALGAALMCDNAFDVDIFHDDTSSTVLASTSTQYSTPINLSWRAAIAPKTLMPPIQPLLSLGLIRLPQSVMPSPSKNTCSQSGSESS
ncbi:hypothetical protein CI102_1783 [Trichoderma harzianum]|nr:hypothetical protein CI102_1783 [Trichoderma harzianum]